MSSPPEGRPSRFAASRRNRVVLGVCAVLLVLRVLLPSLLRPLLVERVDAALVGHIELADLDLSILRGGVTLHGLSLHTDERPSKNPPLLEARRIWTQISWLALLGRTLELEELEMEGFTLRLDRERSGLRLPRPIQSAPDPAANESAPWSFAADAVALSDGEIMLVDHTVAGAPETLALAIEDFSARELAVRGAPGDDEPGRISIDAKLDQGSVALAAWLQQLPTGTDVRTNLVVEDLPIDRLRAYATGFAWRSLSGRLDANLEHHYEPGGEHQLKGTLSLADLRIGVPDHTVDALAWKNLAVAIDRLDFVKRHAELESVEATGVRLLVAPRSTNAIGVLAPPRAKTDAAREAATTDPEAAPAREDRAAATAWTWRVRRARVARSVVELRGTEEPLEVALEATAGPLASEAKIRSPISVVARQGTGIARISGEIVPRPMAFAGRLSVESLSLPPLAAQFEAPALHWLRSGVLRANLKLSLAQDLRMAGSLGIANLDAAAAPVEKQFAVAWKDMAVGIGSLRISPLGSDDPRAIHATLSEVAFVSPNVVLTRGLEGLVLPPLVPPPDARKEPPAAKVVADESTAEPASAKSLDPTEESVPAEPSPKPTPLTLSIARARVEAGRLKLADRTLEPFYRGRLEAIALDASGVRWPKLSAEQLELSVEGLRGARLVAKGAIGLEDSKLEAELADLPLAQFNPYWTDTGYDLRAGALTLASKLRLRPDRYATKNALVLTGLDVGGRDGEAHFKETFGVSLPLARELLSDLDGRITLALPVRGKPDHLEVGVTQLVAQALRKALVGALAAPLKLLRAGRGDGDGDSLSPAPIAFRPGESVLADAVEERVADVADLLAASPAIRLHLTAWTADSDARVVCERALLAQLEASRGVRALASLGELSRRRAVRLHLAAKFAGQSPRALADDDQRWLDRQIERAEAPSQALRDLAQARVESLRALLTREHGVAAERLVVEPPVLTPRSAQPAVALALGAPRTPAPETRAQADPAD